MLAVDVDGTLLAGKHPRKRVVDQVKAKHNDGYQIIVWSSAGEDHARAAINLCGIEGIVHAVISKLGYILDDQRWSWIKYTKVLRF